MNDTSAQEDGNPNSSAPQNQNQNDQKRTSLSQDNAANLSVASLPGKGGGAAGSATGEADDPNYNQSSAGEVKSNSAQSNVGSAGQIGSNGQIRGQGSKRSISGNANSNGNGSIGKLVPIQGNNSGQGSGQIQGQGQSTNGGQCMNVCLKQMPDGSYAIILPPSFVPPSQNLQQGQQQQPQQQGQNQNQNQIQGNNMNQNMLPQIGQNMLMNCGNAGGFLPGAGQNLNQNPNFLGGLQDGTFDGTMPMGGFGMLGMGPGGGNMDPILTMVNGQPSIFDPLTGQCVPIGPGGLILDGTNDQLLGMGMGPQGPGQFPMQFDFGPDGIGEFNFGNGPPGNNGFIDPNGPFDFGLGNNREPMTQNQNQNQGFGPNSKMPGNTAKATGTGPQMLTPDFMNPNPILRNGNGNTNCPGFNGGALSGNNTGFGNQCYQPTSCSSSFCQPLDCYLIPKGCGKDFKPRYELQCCNNQTTPNPNMNTNTNTTCASREVNRRGQNQNPCSLSCTPTPRPQMQVPLPDEFQQPGQNEQRITLIREVYHFKKSPRSCASKKPPCPCSCPCPCPCNQEYKDNNNSTGVGTARDCTQCPCDTSSIISCRPPWSNAFSYKPSCSRKRSAWPATQKPNCCSNSINSMGLLERDRENIFSTNPRSNSLGATPVAIQLQDSCNCKRGQGQTQGQGQGQCQQRQTQITQQSQTQPQPQIEIQMPRQGRDRDRDPCPNANPRNVTCQPIKTIDCGQVYLERQKGCKAPTSLVREFLVTGGNGPDTKKYKAVVATVPPNCCFRTSNILEDGNSQVTCLPSDVQQALINCGLIGNGSGNLLGMPQTLIPGPPQPGRAQSLTVNGLGGALVQQNNNRGSRSGSGAGNQGGRRSRNNSKSAGVGLGNERSVSGKINEIISPKSLVNAIGIEQDVNNLVNDESMNFELDLNDTTATTPTNGTTDKNKTSTLAIMNKSNANANMNTNINANTTRKNSLIDSQPPKKKKV